MFRLFPPANDGPRYEIQSIGRDLDDLSPEEKYAPRPGGVTRPLAYTALAIVALVVFFVGMLLTPSLGH